MIPQNVLRSQRSSKDRGSDLIMILSYLLLFVIMMCTFLLIYALVWLYKLVHAGIFIDPGHSAWLNAF